MKEYVGIYIKTEKAREQDGFGNKMKYHFHIKNLHKYTGIVITNNYNIAVNFEYCLLDTIPAENINTVNETE